MPCSSRSTQTGSELLLRGRPGADGVQGMGARGSGTGRKGREVRAVSSQRVPCSLRSVQGRLQGRGVGRMEHRAHIQHPAGPASSGLLTSNIVLPHRTYTESRPTPQTC